MTQQSRTSDTCETGATGPYRRRPMSKIIRYPSEPVSLEEIRNLRLHQAEFETAFPRIKAENQDILIVSWSEIERQFLDLCAPWDQQNGYNLIQEVSRNAPYQSAEMTLRRLFVINSIRTSIDTPEPKWGTGESFPMP